MLFYANQNNSSSQAQILRYFIKDAYGNIYIMHASGASASADQQANFNNSKLPAGWLKYAGYLPSDLVITPALGVNNAYEYNIFRDNTDSTYHQVYWGGHSPAEYIDGPMEIWGCNTSDTLYGHLVMISMQVVGMTPSILVMALTLLMVVPALILLFMLVQNQITPLLNYLMVNISSGSRIVQ